MRDERICEDGYPDQQQPELNAAAATPCAPHPEPAQMEVTLQELRSERERLLRIIEEQLAVTKTLAARPAQNTSIWWFLLALSLVLVLALVMGAWLYLSQFPALDDGENAGVCVQRSAHGLNPPGSSPIAG